MVKLGRLRDGFKKSRCGNKVHRDPINDKVLSKFLSCLSPSSYDMCTHRATLCFAKSGLMRVSEYTYGINGNKPLVCNIRVIPNLLEPMYLLYYFNKSKTNQYYKQERFVCVCNCPNPCAVHEITHMLQMREQIGPSDPLFWYSNGLVPRPHDINNLIINLCKKCDLDQSAFRSHQLRSGGVVDLLTEGVSDSIVQHLAHWKRLDSMVPYKKLSAENVVTILQARKKQ